MSSFLRFHPISKGRIIRSIVAIAVMLLCVYVGVFEMYRYSTSYLTSFGIILGGNSLISLSKVWIDDDSLNAWKRLLLSIFVLLVFILSYIGVKALRKVYYAHELAEFGQSVSGKVKAAYKPDFYLLSDAHALVRYTFNDRTYFHKINNKTGRFKKDDQLQLIVSSRKPEILKVAVEIAD